MSVAEDLERIRLQEATLVHEAFSEADAFALGCRVRERALAENLPIIVDIRSFDRPLFYAAMPGSNGSNPEWARRKFNVVRRFGKSSYRMVLEKNRPDRTFPVGDALDIADYVLAGGGFPITVRNVGVVGVIAISGLPERDDHAVAVAALAQHLGHDPAALALPPVAAAT